MHRRGALTAAAAARRDHGGSSQFRPATMTALPTSHRPPHHRGEDDSTPEPGQMPVEPDDGAPDPALPSEPAPDGPPTAPQA